MPRVRTKADNDFLSAICSSVYYYSDGKIYYNADSPFVSDRIRRRIKNAGRPVPLGKQRLKSSSGIWYDYYTVDLPMGDTRKKIMAERLVWFLVYNEWPTGNILFRDGDKRNINVENLVNISPRIMQMYGNLIRRLDKNYISENVSIKRKNRKKDIGKGIRFKTNGEDKYWSIHEDHITVVNNVYDWTLEGIADIYINKLDGINMQQYHKTTHRHRIIQKAIKERKQNIG